MNIKHLIWILPLCFLVFGGMGYFKGTLDGANLMVNKCNSRMELTYQINKLEENLLDQTLDLLYTYEENCPEVAKGIENQDIKTLRLEDDEDNDFNGQVIK